MPVSKIEKRTRVVGAARAELAAVIGAQYAQGSSVRELTGMYGRSYGFVHGLLAESGVTIRNRGGRRRAG